jgi:hypothetical protein
VFDYSSLFESLSCKFPKNDICLQNDIASYCICIDEQLVTARCHSPSQDSKPVSLFLENPKSAPS